MRLVRIPLTIFAVALILLGGATTALLLYSERFQASVLCTDPEEFACSGHYVYGVPNEVWSITTLVVGVGLLAVTTTLFHHTHRSAQSRHDKPSR